MHTVDIETVKNALAFACMTSGFILCLVVIAFYLDWRGRKDEEERNRKD